MTWIQWPSLITWLTLILLVALAFDVSRARAHYGIRAPSTSGDEQFERIYRVHMNTLENALVFLPALWPAASGTRARTRTVRSTDRAGSACPFSRSRC